MTRGLKRTINQDPRSTIGAPMVAITAECKTRSPALSRGLVLATVSIRTSPPEIFDIRPFSRLLVLEQRASPAIERADRGRGGVFQWTPANATDYAKRAARGRPLAGPTRAAPVVERPFAHMAKC